MAGPPSGSMAGLHGTRTEAMQRLKVGVGGLLAVLLVVALASSIMQSAQQAEDTDPAVVAQEQQAEPANDPLVDIGVVPELPGEAQVVPDLPAEQMPPGAAQENIAPPTPNE
ncbi:hypothetical protein [Croceicoccus naphthovorans]|uniref:hypothetical protein n=1 Tax=Croceicoccus naphthovorans TaxID=1348774 RepID=UPI00069D2450|nr:hypothetical protein [Croceicoccus naphthovorans]MBB3988959.1 hypothetical protein [Croceicoccus naphthovorans]